MRRLAHFVVWSAAMFAANPPWLDAVGPILKPAEKKAYLALTPTERAKYEANFWTGKSISAEEYFQRVQYIDANFGSGQLGSGANTDPGRVYLSIGPPVRIRRIPSSRLFVPLDIWYYDDIPGLINTEVRLIFYRKNGEGFPKLYSPELDTIRALLLPQAATINTFGPNDSVSEATLRTSLNVPPAEDEVVTAAVNVATGIKYSGNGQIIGQVLSPGAMLTRDLHSIVESRLVSTRAPRLDFLLSKSPFGAVQVDMALEVTAQREIQIEVMDGPVTVYQNRLALKFEKSESVQYLHRLDLLPGSYRIAMRADGKTFYYPLEVAKELAVSEIVLAAESSGGAAHGTPFEFNPFHLYPSAGGRFAVLSVPQASEVSWTIRRGLEVVWRQKTTAGGSVAVLPLPFDSLAPGKYQLEANTGGETRRTDLEIGKKLEDPRPLVSFNANLANALRNAQVGHEWLLRGDTKQASRYLETALREGQVKEAQVDLARIDALSGRWDQARDRLRPILAEDPENFEALCVYAYLEAELQDYAVAAEYFQRALAVQDSPAVRLTLSQLPR